MIWCLLTRHQIHHCIYRQWSLRFVRRHRRSSFILNLYSHTYSCISFVSQQMGRLIVSSFRPTQWFPRNGVVRISAIISFVGMYYANASLLIFESSNVQSNTRILRLIEIKSIESKIVSIIWIIHDSSYANTVLR